MNFFKEKQKYEGPAKFYCKKCGAYRGRKRQYTCNVSNPIIDEDSYLVLKRGFCDKCKATPNIKSIFNFKKIKWNSLPVFIAFAVAMITVVTVIVLIIAGGGTPKEKAEKQYEKLLSKYEEIEHKTTMKSGSILLKESFIKEMQAVDNYVMNIYAEDADSTVQKITENGKVTYYLDLHGVEFGDYSNRSYIWTDEVVYEFGEEGNIKYYKDSYEYALTSSKIKQFLPENFCLNGKPKTEIYAKDEDENEIYIFNYTEYKHALDYPDGFFEKYGDRLTKVDYGKEDPILSVPKDVKWVEYE